MTMADRSANPKMKLPDFVIIGAAKSGTTTIYRHLLGSDEIYMSNPKEPEFFARDERYSMGTAWYSGLFANAREDQLCGEASTLYSLAPLFPETAKRMHATIPAVKLVYIMRNPVNRAYSYYVQLVKNYQNCYQTTEVPRTFEEILFSDQDLRETNCPSFASYDSHLPYGPQLLIAGGMYIEQIMAYKAHFDSEKMHLMVFEDFVGDTHGEINALLRFIGVHTTLLEEEFINHKENVSSTHFNNLWATTVLENIKSLPILGRLGKKLPESARKGIFKLLASSELGSHAVNKSIPGSMLPATEKYLKELYLEPTYRLSELLGRDLVKLWGLQD